MNIKRENGNIFVDVVSCQKEIEQSVAYNFNKEILGYGEDLINWNVFCDTWGWISEKHYKGNHRYTLKFSEIQFARDEVSKIIEG